MEANSSNQFHNLIPTDLLIFHLGLFTLVMILSTMLIGRRLGTKSGEAFIVVNRQIPWWLGGPSIAASWTWAVALMISVQMAYQQGIAGIFWFTVPNIIAVLIYIWLGPQIRKKMPLGYSLPEWMHFRFKNKRLTYLYLFVFYYYQVLAVTVQVYAGAHLLSVATGLSTFTLMPTILLITLAYGIVSGLQASIITDLIQMVLILVPGWILVWLVIAASEGNLNFHGVLPSGSLNPFEPSVMFTAGIISSIGLISGSICDQQFWQRCFAIKEADLRKTFLFGGLLFASVPISLSLLGFTAAAPEVGLNLPPDFDFSLVGFAVVHKLLPAGVAILYLYMLLAGLCSTLDSGLSAASSLDALLQKRPWESGILSQEISLPRARRSMLIISCVGLGLAYAVECIPGFGLKYFWWFFNSIAACMAIPIVLSLFWDRLTVRGITVSSTFGLLVGLPLVVYSSVTANDWMLSGSYLGIVVFSLASCWITRKRLTL